MTHINSREYIDSSSISVSDNTDNEAREGDGIFSGIFSVVDLSEKVEPKNNRSDSDSIKSEKTSEEGLYDEDRAKGNGENINPKKASVELAQTEETENYLNAESFDSKGSELRNFARSGAEIKSDVNTNDETSPLNTEELSVKSENLTDDIANLTDAIANEVPKMQEKKLTHSSIVLNKKEAEKHYPADTKNKGKATTLSNVGPKPSVENTLDNDEKLLKKDTVKNDTDNVAKINTPKGRGNLSNTNLIERLSSLENKNVTTLPIDSDDFSDEQPLKDFTPVNKETFEKKVTRNENLAIKNTLTDMREKKRPKGLEQIQEKLKLEKTTLREIALTQTKKINKASDKNSSSLANFDQKSVSSNDSSQSASSNSNQQNSQHHSNSSGFGTKLNSQILQQLDLRDKNAADGIMKRLEKAMQKGLSSFELNLRPKNLGKLRIGISIENNITNVKILTETHSAALLLSDYQAKLANMMDAAGLRLADFSSITSRDSSNRDNSDQKKNETEIENKKKIKSDKINDKDNQKSLENSDNSLLNIVA